MATVMLLHTPHVLDVSPNSLQAGAQGPPLFEIGWSVAAVIQVWAAKLSDPFHCLENIPHAAAVCAAVHKHMVKV